MAPCLAVVILCTRAEARGLLAKFVTLKLARALQDSRWGNGKG